LTLSELSTQRRSSDESGTLTRLEQAEQGIAAQRGELERLEDEMVARSTQLEQRLAATGGTRPEGVRPAWGGVAGRVVSPADATMLPATLMRLEQAEQSIMDQRGELKRLKEKKAEDSQHTTALEGQTELPATMMRLEQAEQNIREQRGELKQLKDKKAADLQHTIALQGQVGSLLRSTQHVTQAMELAVKEFLPERDSFARLEDVDKVRERLEAQLEAHERELGTIAYGMGRLVSVTEEPRKANRAAA